MPGPELTSDHAEEPGEDFWGKLAEEWESHRRPGRRRWDRVSAYDGIDGFFESLLAADPARAELIKQRRQELARASRDNVVVRGGKAELVRPIMCRRLAPPK